MFYLQWLHCGVKMEVVDCDGRRKSWWGDPFKMLEGENIVVKTTQNRRDSKAWDRTDMILLFSKWRDRIVGSSDLYLLLFSSVPLFTPFKLATHNIDKWVKSYSNCPCKWIRLECWSRGNLLYHPLPYPNIPLSSLQLTFFIVFQFCWRVFDLKL